MKNSIKLLKKVLSVGILSACVSGLAMADAVATTNNVATNPANHWQIRVRGIYVQPEVSSQYLDNYPGVKATNVSSAIAPEIDFNYFFTPNWSTELILATTRHSVDATNATDLGSVWLLPPTLTVLYHFVPGTLISPYLGMGVNYTWFYNVGSSSNPAITNVHYDSAPGVAFQAGLDVNFNPNWSFNIDVKKILLKTTAHVDVAGVPNTTNVILNPWIFGAGLGYRF